MFVSAISSVAVSSVTVGEVFLLGFFSAVVVGADEPLSLISLFLISLFSFLLLVLQKLLFPFVDKFGEKTVHGDLSSFLCLLITSSFASFLVNFSTIFSSLFLLTMNLKTATCEL
jgi:hypothetical protein